ncbi:hypothetical protein FOCC_FOCC006593 [Frankliniella occidentalis]|nr:hypothetical protein FOCC_FOCC006593 [Frankliniella occidentalis]
MRNIGLGMTALKTFCVIVDLNPPVWASAYDVIVDSICTAAVEVGNSSMMLATSEEITASGNPEELAVSGDGS